MCCVCEIVWDSVFKRWVRHTSVTSKIHSVSPAVVPIVTLKMGSSLNPEDIKEGDDVYFECHMRANPKAYKLSWYHNVSSNLSQISTPRYSPLWIINAFVFQGVEMHHNVSLGVILSDQSLVLQSVTRATAGEFKCIAANVEGRGTSNPVTLTVRCKLSLLLQLLW